MLETILTPPLSFLLRACLLPGWETVALFTGFAVVAVLAVKAEKYAARM